VIGVYIAVAIVFILICISELLWRRRKIDTEYTRKFVHISVGSFVAFWPLFLSRAEIVGLSAVFVAVVAVSYRFKLFKAIHSVQRPTWGEICFALSVGLLAVLAPNNWVYAAALLHMSLADGLAAVIGMRFGRSSRYRIAGYTKSIAGTLTFFFVSLGILAAYALLVPEPFGLWLIAAAGGATVLENFAIRGLDNLLIPVYIAAILGFVS
jgi:phytol kinase